MIKENNFLDIHKKLIEDALIIENNVMLNKMFTLTNPKNNLGINSNKEYYEKFKEWLFTGSDKRGEFIKMSPKAQKYHLEYKGRNIAYGPRIIRQLPIIIDKLRKVPNTRQAFLNILDERDHIVFEQKSKNKVVEYPCTVGWYFTNQNGRLECTSIMRSNNIVSVVGLDVYLGTNLQMHIAEELGLKLGYYTHVMLNAHIIPEEIKRAYKYLKIYSNLIKNSI